MTITPGGSPPGTYSRDAIERGDEPTERDVEELARLLARVDVHPHAAALDRARAILASDWYAGRIAEARSEGAAEVTARVGALADAWDDPDPERGDPDKADALRAALRGDA